MLCKLCYNCTYVARTAAAIGVTYSVTVFDIHIKYLQVLVSTVPWI
jgi:hypothetical protein